MDSCWICLDPSAGLVRHCACPKVAHAKCVARWQLQKAGHREETHCRFCQHSMADWRDSIGVPDADVPCTMAVTHGGVTKYVRVHSARRAERAEIERVVREMFGISDASELCLDFDTYKVPGSDERIEDKGAETLAAAMHCAAASARERASL